ncbi:xanthine dehydrogenase molybdopterin binding subunit [Limnohabitans sp. TEGF004]|uniref:xanthine dehydrogenase molybdopterin binding subunit n=1 Tax=Limnohabitans sp. TEGF004 TaxID=2986281 RepID=UPI00237787EC|nr:xanthine dehydrogenase molybdopterin binding subunit [Limnohabitans sp. TEGF004]BDU56908.1 xanthine dehydrogenase large subunit [Limnohabitans sp. TEGF004]
MNSIDTLLKSSDFHESAVGHVQGTAPYVDDMPLIEGTLHGVVVLSSRAAGALSHVDWVWAQSQEGVSGVVTGSDIPGSSKLATYVADENIFAESEIAYHGQVLGLVVAKRREVAARVANSVPMQIDAKAPTLDARQACAQSSFVLPSVHLERGALDAGWQESVYQLSGKLEVGGQEHFYLEGQVAYAIAQADGRWEIYSSTQHPGEVQHWVAHALDIPMHQVRVICRRMGGGFGGKETQAGHLAVWAALAANKFKVPVKVRLDRKDDMLVTGKRHPFSHEWHVGFDADGRVKAFESLQMAHCGHSADLSGPVADRAIFHTDNAYWLPAVKVTSHRCKMNTQSHTAFRGFGGPQGVILIETVMGDVARCLKKDALDVRLQNLYGIQERNITPYGMEIEDNVLEALITQLATDCQYRVRREEIKQWNAQSESLKKGLALTPVKFGISFTATQFNQAGALVSVFTDGSVLVNHGGTEMGQGLHTKVCLVVARTLGISEQRVRISASDTDKVANASATAASSGTDMNGRAAEYAALRIKKNIADCLAKNDGCFADEVTFIDDSVVTPRHKRSFEEAVQFAYKQRVQLWSDGFYATPKINYDPKTLTGRPFYYFSYGAACSEVAIDLLTGEYKLLRTDILHDVGRSIHPEIDIGQIEGGFLQGVGWLTTEELVWDQDGKLLTQGASTYKIPTAADVPEELTVSLWMEENREANVGGSKAVGEPPFMLGISVFEALRDAVGSVRDSTTPVELDAPATPERVLKAVTRVREVD